MKKALVVLTISLIAILSLAACAKSPTVVSNVPQIRTLSASGVGKVYLVPDVAYINIGVRVDADEVSTALSENNIQANEIATALQKLGVEMADIQTSNFNVYPMMDYGIDGEVSRRYFVVENTVYVTVRNLSNLGSLLDAVVRSGANTINGISFDVQDKSAAVAQARDEAIEKARAEAEAIATAAGVKLGTLQSVNVYTSSGTTPYYEVKGIGGAGGADNVPVAAGQMLISVDANVTYEIK